MLLSKTDSHELDFSDNKEYWTYLWFLEMMLCNAIAAGHDMRPSVVLLLKSDKVVLNQQYCFQQTTWLLLVIHMVTNYSQICLKVKIWC